jgi:hypothetical protein
VQRQGRWVIDQGTVAVQGEHRPVPHFIVFAGGWGARAFWMIAWIMRIIFLGFWFFADRHAEGRGGDWEFEAIGRDEHRLTIAARSVEAEVLRAELGVVKIMKALKIRRKGPVQFSGMTLDLTDWK